VLETKKKMDDEASNPTLPESLPTFRNPVLRGFNPDPSICRVGDTWYIATSTFEWYPGIQIFRSRNLIDWEFVCRPLNRPDLLDMNGVPDSCGVWAPALSWSDGKFWLTYTIVRRFDGNFKDTHNYLTTCGTINGEWSERTYLNSSGFDPSLFHDTDGRKWLVNMVWDHRADRTFFGGIMLQEYSHEKRSLVGPRRIIFKGSDTGLTEGPHLYRIDGRYYLMTAEGGTGYDHAVTMARAEDIWGPYEVDPDLHVVTARNKPGKPLQRCGHGSMAEAEDGYWFMPHLCSRSLPAMRHSPMGRETALQQLSKTKDGWFRLASPEGAFDLYDNREKCQKKYEFTTDSLHSDFQWLRIPDASRIMSLTENPTTLRLYGREALGSQFEQALIARRQAEFSFRAETEITFDPSDFQQMAGLVLYYNAHKFHYLFISYEEGIGRYIGVMSCEAALSQDVVFPMGKDAIPIPGNGPIRLSADISYSKLQFGFSTDNGENWATAGPVLSMTYLTDEAGKGEGANFTGTFVGMACQDIAGLGRSADFSYFLYQER